MENLEYTPEMKLAIETYINAMVAGDNDKILEAVADMRRFSFVRTQCVTA